jgi:hypothetical protein
MQKIRNTKRKSIPYADFNSSQPNIVQVGKKYVKSGNVCLGIEKVIHGNSKTWRFGKHPMTLHPFTFIDIAGQNYIELETQAILKFIHTHWKELRLIETPNFNNLVTKSYLVRIDDLVAFCKEHSSLKQVA